MVALRDEHTSFQKIGGNPVPSLPGPALPIRREVCGDCYASDRCREDGLCWLAERAAIAAERAVARVKPTSDEAALSEPGETEVAESAETVMAPATGRGVARWDRESAVLAVKARFVRTGQVPRQKDAVGDPLLPNPSTVRTLGWSWADLIENSGFDRPTRGGYARGKALRPEHRDAIREGMARASGEPARPVTVLWPVLVKGTGLRYRSSDEAYVAADEIEADGVRVAEDARFDGDDAKAEFALDASRELAAAVRASARMGKRREDGERAEESRRADPDLDPEPDEEQDGDGEDFPALLAEVGAAMVAHDDAFERLAEASARLKAHPLYRRARDSEWL